MAKVLVFKTPDREAEPAPVVHRGLEASQVFLGCLVALSCTLTVVGAWRVGLVTVHFIRFIWGKL